MEFIYAPSYLYTNVIKEKILMKILRDSVALVCYVVLLCLAGKNINK